MQKKNGELKPARVKKELNYFSRHLLYLFFSRVKILIEIIKQIIPVVFSTIAMHISHAA